MKKCEMLFKRAASFQSERGALVAAHEKKLQEISRFEGSAGFRDELKKINSEYEAAVANLQNNYSQDFTAILRMMVDAIHSRSIVPPTDDQTKALEALRIRKKITEDELQRTAHLCGDNPLALQLLDDIAEQQGHLRRFARLCPEITNDSAERIVKSLADNLTDFLQNDTAKGARLEAKFHTEKYGAPAEPRKLPKRRMFETQSDFYRDFARLDDVGLKQFEAAIGDEQNG